MTNQALAEQYLARVQRALARARMWNAKSWRMGPGTYRVASATEVGKAYDVTVRSYGVNYGICFERLCCQCEAGLKKQPCRHGAKVALRLEREGKARAGGRKRAPRRPVLVESTAVMYEPQRPVTVETVGDELFAGASVVVAA